MFRPAVAFAVAVLVLAGCNSNPRTAPVKSTTPTEPDDPIQNVRDTLRKERDLNGCKTALQQLGVYLQRAPERTPAPLAADEKALLEEFGFGPADLEEVGKTSFTNLDNHHLEQCLLLNDALRSLDLNWSDTSEAAALARARAAFAWVVRQMAHSSKVTATMPPVYALKRGTGNPAERAFAALAAFHQLGLDSCMIGRRANGPINIWAVGVRVGSDVYTFSPLTGQPLPGPGGKGIATLRQLRADPALIKPALPADETSDLAALAKDSEAIAAAALSALAPRMRFAQSLLASTPPLILAVDPVALKERFATSGEKLAFWAPAERATSPTWNLAYSLSPEEGGLNPDPAAARTIPQFYLSLIPWGQLPPQVTVENLAGDPGDRIRSFYGQRFLNFFTESKSTTEGVADESSKMLGPDSVPKGIREMVLRGNYEDATRTLVDLTTRVQRMHQRFAVETDLEPETDKWVAKIRSSYAAWLRAQRETGADSDVTLKARAEVDELTKRSEHVIKLVERAAAGPVGCEATYQLALCKHEQAERLSREVVGGSGDAETRDAWETAAGWWDTFLTKYALAPYADPAKVNAARALQKEARAKADAKGP